MMMQNGGPSQMDLFDPKPELTKNNGKTANVETYQLGNSDKLMASPLAFKKYGQCGLEMSELLPHLGSLADELCVIRSMYSEHNNHTEALVLLNTGKIFPGRPSLGSWVSYGLGSENQNLPAYIVLRDPEGYNTSGTLLWQNGWLPAQFRGTEVSTQGSPVVNLRPQNPLPPPCKRKISRCWPGSTRSIAKATRSTASSKPASAITSWPPACSSPRGTFSISPRKRRRPKSSTASTTLKPPATAPAA